MNRFTSQDSPVSADSSARIGALAPESTQKQEGTTRPIPEDALIIVPVRNIVLFPGLVVPLGMGRQRSVAAVQEAVRLQRPIGVLLQNAGRRESGPGRSALGRHDRERAALRHDARRCHCDGSGPRPRVLQFRRLSGRVAQ
jgi:hypothetical protein